MKEILINAYACCPEMGSEQGMGWNFAYGLAKKGCEVFVVTESEYQLQIENYLRSEKQIDRKQYSCLDCLHFYFIPVGDTEEDSIKIRKMCWNQGTWSFYPHYAKWQQKILPTVNQIIEGNNIDVMHQLNMAGFREPGMLYKINEEREKKGKERIPLVWGPMTGYGGIPFKFMTSGGIKFTAFYLLKNTLNTLQLLFHPRVRKMMKASDWVMATSPEMMHGIEKYYGRQVERLNETGCFNKPSKGIRNIENTKSKTFKILWVGRFIYTKQLPLAFKTMSKLHKLPNIELHVVGKALDEHTEDMMHYRAEEAGCDSVVKWHGQIPNAEVQQLMRECDVFLFTSIFEGTSTVILEAITNNLPVVCFDRCGFGPVIDEKIGRKIKCKNPKQAVNDFAEAITYLYNHPEELQQMKRNCEVKKIAMGWDAKMMRLMEIYNSVCNG